MKVKEVEIFNSVYQESGTLTPSPKNMVTAHLEKEGSMVMVTIGKDVAADHIRRVTFDYNIVDMQFQTYSHLNIPTILQITADVLPFNIEVVTKTLIRSSASVVTVNFDISIFTYEANINTSYGSKRLSYPYRADLSENTGFPLSTDGWYTMTVLDIPLWNAGHQYVIGDIVYSPEKGGFAKCTVANINHDPMLDQSVWDAPSDEAWDVYAIATNRMSDHDAKLRIYSDLLLTRNIKQAYIFPCIQSTNFKDSNDKVGMAGLTKITAMREAAVAYLESGDPIKAVNMINRVPFEYHTLFGPNRTVVISNNNFTL